MEVNSEGRYQVINAYPTDTSPNVRYIVEPRCYQSRLEVPFGESSLKKMVGEIQLHENFRRS